jgi:hypothetical protein
MTRCTFCGVDVTGGHGWLECGNRLRGFQLYLVALREQLIGAQEVGLDVNEVREMVDCIEEVLLIGATQEELTVVPRKLLARLLKEARLVAEMNDAEELPAEYAEARLLAACVACEKFCKEKL